MPSAELMEEADEPGPSWQPGKVSEIIVDFARPMIETFGGGPADVETLRNMMMLVCVCWNVPVLQATGDPDVAEHLHWLQTLPEPLKRMLDDLMRDRRTRFASIPFLVTVEVRGTDLKNASIYAEARPSAGTFCGWS